MAPASEVIPPTGRVVPLMEEITSDVRVQKLAVYLLTLFVVRLLAPFYVVMSLTFVLTFIGSSIVDTSQRVYIKSAQAVVRRLGGVEKKKVFPTEETGTTPGRSWAKEILAKLETRKKLATTTKATPPEQKSDNHWIVPPRKFFAGSYVATCLMLTTWLIVHYGPIVASQSQYVTSTIARDDPYVAAAAALRTGLGDAACARLDVLARSLRFDDFFLSVGQSTTKMLTTESLASTLRQLVSPYLVNVVALCSTILRPVPSLLYDVATAGIFSLLIVWDLPRLAKNFASLGRSQVKWISFTYKEVAPKVRSLAKLVGTNFEVQGLIAVVNTALTTAGLLLLKISGIPFLAFLTFFCSFVPILGVAVATAPALFIALAESGFRKLLEVLLMVTVVHLVEAYVLYPQIYASKLKVHPILVLASLYVFDHLFGWKGLFIALPVSVFLLQTLLGIQPPAYDSSSSVTIPPSDDDSSSDTSVPVAATTTTTTS